MDKKFEDSELRQKEIRESADRSGDNTLLKKLINFSVLPISILYIEIIIKIFAVGTVFDKNLFYIFFFSVSTGLLLSFFANISEKPKTNRTVTIVLLSVITVLTGTQLFCRRTFGVYFGASVMAENGAGALTGFVGTVVKIIVTGLPIITLMFVPLICYCVFGTLFLKPGKISNRNTLVLFCTAVISYILPVVVIMNSSSGIVTDRGYYTEHIELNGSSDRFGLLTGLRLDLQNLLFGELYSQGSQEDGDIGDIVIVNDTESEINSETETETETQPTLVEYGYNTMDIDFSHLLENESNAQIKSLHKYFSEKTGTKQNQYTGYFAGKNLIYITAEAFSPWFISEELTPTLYMLTHEGFVFKNFYQPSWGVSTSDGEYSGLIGLVPQSGINSMYRTRLNNMYFTLGNQFSRQGYNTYAYHDHTYTYYNRNITHPNLGYEFSGVGNGVEKYTNNVWPRSDLEMMEGSVPLYIDKEPFHVYYMSVSGHGGYSRTGNSMAYKNWDKVKDLDYSDTVKAYIAANLEFEYAMESLIRQLDEANILDDTVIVITNDHYPYGLDMGFEGNSTDYYSELAGHELERNFEVYKNSLIIWNSAMENPIIIDKPCYSLDILPTLSNLFGLEYDSRLLMGSDILSDSEGLVLFRNFSWLTEKGAYDATTNTFTASEGSDADAEYVSRMSRMVKDKVEYSEAVLQNDYYGVLFGK